MVWPERYIPKPTIIPQAGGFPPAGGAYTGGVSLPSMQAPPRPGLGGWKKPSANMPDTSGGATIATPRVDVRPKPPQHGGGPAGGGAPPRPNRAQPAPRDPSEPTVFIPRGKKYEGDS
jgi:hypothetical protein